MKKRVLVLTGTTDYLRRDSTILPDHLKFWQEDPLIIEDNTMEEVFDLTLPSKIRYAKRHGYDILVMRSFGKETSLNFHEYHVGFMKMIRTFQMLSNYDVVMWIDADTIICKEDMPIEEFGLSSGHSLYASWDWQWKQSFSTGNFILQRTEKTNELFRVFVQVAQNFLTGWGEEQITLNTIYKNTPLSSTIKILDHSYLNSVPKCIEDTIFWGTKEKKTRPPIMCPWNESSFLAHICGISNKSRIEILNANFSQNF